MQRAAACLLRTTAQVLGAQRRRATGREGARPVEGRALRGGAMPCIPLRTLPPVTLACASGCGVPEAQAFFAADCCAEISGRSGFTRSMPTGSGGMAPQLLSLSLSLTLLPLALFADASVLP